MSVLDKAPHQSEQQRQFLDDTAHMQRLMSEFSILVESAQRRPPFWMSAALAFLSLALVGTWLVMAAWWFAPLKTLSEWQLLNKPDVRSAITLDPVSSIPEPELPLSVTATTEAVSGPALDPTLESSDRLPVAASLGLANLLALPSSTLAAAKVSSIEPDKPGLVNPSNKFVHPTWHKAAHQLWNWGRWEEASSSWLKGLSLEEPNTPLLLIADQLTQLQVTRQYAAWSPLLPVVALPKSGVIKKRWMLLAVPAASDMARAKQLLQIAQGQEARVERWTYWQKILRLSNGTESALAATEQNVVPEVSAAPSTVTSPALRNTVLSPFVASLARNSSVAKDQGQALEGGLAQSNQEQTLLSPTEPERLPGSGPVPLAVKADDVNYQKIEKFLVSGDYQSALDAAIKLEKYIGDNWRTHYLVGVAHMGLSRWDQAITALSQAHELNSRNATVGLYFSLALQERGEHVRAIQVLDKTQQLQPLSPELWLNLGHSHQALGHKVEARKAYKRFLELSVNRQDLAVQRAWVQNRLQKNLSGALSAETG